MAKRKSHADSQPETPAIPQVGERANCDRCKKEIQIAPRRREDSKPFRLAVVPKGVCPDCVMTQFLYNTYPINMQLDRSGPSLLLNPQIRGAFLMSGILDDCDMSVDEVNWQRVVDNWSLPVDNKPSATNPYQMGDAAKGARDLMELEDAVVRSDDVITEMLLSAGVARENIDRAIHSDAGTRVVAHGGSYTLEDLRARRAGRQLQTDPFGLNQPYDGPCDAWPGEQAPIGKGELTFITRNPDGSYEQRRVKDILPPPGPPRCPFCGFRGCLHCETVAKEERKARARQIFDDLDLGSKPS